MPNQAECLVVIIESFKDKNVPIARVVDYLDFAFR
jgi:hypothetical protein